MVVRLHGKMSRNFVLFFSCWEDEDIIRDRRRYKEMKKNVFYGVFSIEVRVEDKRRRTKNFIGYIFKG